MSEKALRKARVIQGQVADACGVSGPAVNQWLSGKTRSVDPRHLAAVAACTSMSVAWLTTGRGSRARSERDPMSPAESKLLEDFRRLTPTVRAEVGRLVRPSLYRTFATSFAERTPDLAAHRVAPGLWPAPAPGQEPDRRD
jgi:transcriptional regulator with XRE-family HTH domain